MNLFKDTDPTIATSILLAIVGFFLTDTLKEIRSQPVLQYNLTQATDDTPPILRLSNLSTSEAIVAQRMTLHCREPCFATTASPQPTKLVPGVAPPLAVSEGFTPDMIIDTTAGFSLTLIANSSIDIRILNMANPDVNVEFFVEISPYAPQPLYLVSKKSLMGFALRNYQLGMAILFILALAILAMLAVRSIRPASRPPKQNTPEKERKL